MNKDIALLFLIPHVPALPTLSVRLPSGRTVTEQLGDDELRACHEDLVGEVREVLRKGLVPLEGTGLRFVGPPVLERKQQVEADLAVQAVRFVTFRDLVIAKWAGIAEQMKAFYEDYGEHVRHRRPTDLDEDAIRRRFSLSWSWLPFLLPQALQDQMFTPEEQIQLRREIEEAARESVGRKVEGYLREMVGCLETMAAALRDNRVASRKTLARMTEAYREVAAIVPHAASSEEHAERVRQFGRLIADMAEARQACDVRKERPAAFSALAVAVDAARREAEPLLDAWTVEMEEPDALAADSVGMGGFDLGALLGAEPADVPALATA